MSCGGAAKIEDGGEATVALEFLGVVHGDGVVEARSMASGAKKRRSLATARSGWSRGGARSLRGSTWTTISCTNRWLLMSWGCERVRRGEGWGKGGQALTGATGIGGFAAAAESDSGDENGQPGGVLAVVKWGETSRASRAFKGT
jgi:hypothetical protein